MTKKLLAGCLILCLLLSTAGCGRGDGDASDTLSSSLPSQENSSQSSSNLSSHSRSFAASQSISTNSQSPSSSFGFPFNSKNGYKEITAAEQQNILGQISDLVYSYELRNNDLYVHALSAKDLDVQHTVIFEGGELLPFISLYDPYIRGEHLFFLSQTHILILSSSLEIVLYQQLPDTLLLLIIRGYDDSGKFYAPPEHHFGGYAVNEAGTLLYYTTENGIFAYDLTTHTHELLFGDDDLRELSQPIPLNQSTLFSPRLTLDERTLYLDPFIFEEGSGLVRVSLATKELFACCMWDWEEFYWNGDEVSAEDFPITTLFTQETAHFGRYLNGLCGWGTPNQNVQYFVGSSFYTATVYDHNQNTTLIFASPLGADQLQAVVSFPNPGSFPEVTAILDDGRIVFSYEGAQFITGALR